jgi:hypothetical protein
LQEEPTSAADVRRPSAWKVLLLGAAIQLVGVLFLGALARKLGVSKRLVLTLGALALISTGVWFVRAFRRRNEPDLSILRVETDLFEHREIKPHFINPCCFGEDFAGWLRGELSKDSEFRLTEPWQEDWGWGFEASRDGDCFYVTLHYGEKEPVDHSARWAVAIDPCRGWLPLHDVLGRFDRPALQRLRDRTWQILGDTPGIRVVGHG